MPELSRLVLEIDSKGVVTANGNLDLFKKKSDEAAQAAGRTKTANSQAQGGLDSLASQIGISTIAWGGIIAAELKFVNACATASGQIEMLKTNLQVVTGSADIAKSTFEQLQTFAASTPFSISGITDTATQLLQVGVSADDLMDRLKMLGDVSGGSQEKLNRIMANYTQILSVGKASTMDIRQFAQANLPIYSELEKVTGKTGEALQDMITNGQITGDVITRAFQDMTTEGGKFYNGMEIQSKTYNGLLSTLKDSLSNTQAEFGNLWILGFEKSAMSALTAVSDKAGEFFKWVNAQGEYGRSDKAVMSGGGTNDQILEVSNARIEAITNQLNANSSLMRLYGTDDIHYSAIEDENAELRYNLAYWEKRKNEIVDSKNAEASYNAGKTATGALEKQFVTNLDTQNGIDTDPDNAKVRAIKEQIAAQKELYNTFYAGKDSVKIAENIAFLESELKELIKTKTELFDWQKVLKDALNLEEVTTGAKAVVDYEGNIEASLDGALSYAQAFGGNISAVYLEYADKVDSAIKTLLESGEYIISEPTIKKLIAIKDRLTDGSLGINTPSFDNSPVVPAFNSQMPFTTEAFQSTMPNFGISLSSVFDDNLLNPDKVDEKDKQAERLAEIYKNLGDQLKQFAADATFDALWDMGEALYEGEDAAKAFGQALLKSILQNVPAMLFQAGFQMAITGNVYGGLALMAASGLAGVAGGYLTSMMNDSDGGQSEADKLQTIADQLSDLITQARSDALYYQQTLQSKQASYANSITSVNDAIIAPGGKIITTAPDDYLIATKTPGSLGGSGGTNVFISVANEAGDVATASATQKTNVDGTMQILIAVKKIVNSGLATGEFDSGMDARERRLGGRRVSN